MRTYLPEEDVMLSSPAPVAPRQTTSIRLTTAELAEIRSCLTEGLRSRRAYARVCEAELEAARLAYADEPGALTRIELDFWTTSARLGRKAAAQVEKAVARLSQDGFGICRACGTRIPVERLVAVPGSEVCAACPSGQIP
jgi:RNA polymerase-binding transcription factor DksA